MHALQTLRCYICSCSLTEFVVLSCNHAICGQCISAYYQSDSDLLTVPCPCGLTTNIPTYHKTRESSSTCLKTCHSLPSFKDIKNQILDQSQFAIKDTSTAGVSRINNKHNINMNRQHELRRNTVGHRSTGSYLINELANQIKFMELRFKRYLNQINRHYGKLIVQLNRKHTQITKQIMSKCKSKIQSHQILNLAAIQQHIQKIFKYELEGKLIKISKYLFNCISTLKEDQMSKSIMKIEKQNIKSENMIRKNSVCKIERLSTHENCKRQQCYTNAITIMKQKTVNNNKLTKKRLKNKLRTVYF